jgi:plasmid maintenance system antidote protein VapI
MKKKTMSNKISENTELTLDLKTLTIIVAFVVTVVGMWFALQKDIDLAKELPKPEVSRTEYDLKDQLIRETIMNTQDKVEQNSDKLDKIDEKLYQIIKK